MGVTATTVGAAAGVGVGVGGGAGPKEKVTGMLEARGTGIGACTTGAAGIAKEEAAGGPKTKGIADRKAHV